MHQLTALWITLLPKAAFRVAVKQEVAILLMVSYNHELLPDLSPAWISGLVSGK